ncbi:MAG: type II toxin-antitoxin system VapC family toxin [Deltaproteobacteria bacterium]|nr:type II toxin-antitoxin system VapC family toxin [Deltaproteobacteria bacterium]
MGEINYVVDTSVIVKWFVDEEGREEALQLLNRFFQRDIDLVIPILAFYELGNVLKLRTDVSLGSKTSLLREFFELGVAVAPFGEEIATRTLERAIEYNLSYYDATFLVAAEEVGATLITADKRFYNKVQRCPQIRFLGELEF